VGDTNGAASDSGSTIPERRSISSRPTPIRRRLRRAGPRTRAQKAAMSAAAAISSAPDSGGGGRYHRPSPSHRPTGSLAGRRPTITRPAPRPAIQQRTPRLPRRPTPRWRRRQRAPRMGRCRRPPAGRGRRGPPVAPVLPPPLPEGNSRTDRRNQRLRDHGAGAGLGIDGGNDSPLAVSSRGYL